MNLPSSSITRDDYNEQLNRREKPSFNRFLSFHENTLSSVENRRRSLNETTSNFSEDNKDQPDEIISFECTHCWKIFASEFGLNYHMNMYHPSQSVVCSDCNVTFRSHRALKNHQQRFHLNYSQNLPDYHHLSSYLFLGFSTQQFSFVAKHACEQGRLPLGQFTSKLFPCQFCHVSFPCSNALQYHLLNKHDQYEYEVCRITLHDVIVQVEENIKTVDLNNNDDNDNIESMKYLLAKRASIFGLRDKKLADEIRCIKHEHQQLIFPSCQHSNRTCANLCLKYLSSYHKLVENYSYQIPTAPKGNPFAQGSIVSRPMSRSLISLGTPLKDGSSPNAKRTSLKRVQSAMSERSLSPQSKKKTNEQQFKMNGSKLLTAEPISISPRKNQIYPRSMSSKNARHSVACKRSVSPTITLAAERSSEKRRRQREEKKTKTYLSSSRKAHSTEQESDDDDDDDDDVIPAKSDTHKRQREASDSSIEYVQVLHNEPQTVSSLNNIENFKLTSKGGDKDIIICDPSPTTRKLPSSPSKNLSNGHQTADYDEHVRVRCKICGDILEGRSRFSKHVLTMHSHLIKTNTSNIKQPQQTTSVR